MGIEEEILYSQTEQLPDNFEITVSKFKNNKFYYSIGNGSTHSFIGNSQFYESEKWIGADPLPELEQALLEHLGDPEAVRSFIDNRFDPNIELLIQDYDPEYQPQKENVKTIKYNPGNLFELDINNNCITEIIYMNKKGEDKPVPISHYFINAYPENGIFQQSPVDSTITYKIDWRLHSRHRIPTEGTGQEIFNILKRNGRIVSTKYGVDRKLDFILDTLAKDGTFTKDYKIKIPGFHLVNGNIEAVEYKNTLPGPESVKSALETLEEFAGYFKTDNFDLRDKLASIIKITMISPFDYIKKTLGYPVETVFSYGAPATSKTTVTQIVRFFYQIKKEYFMQTGGAGNTPAQLSGLMMEATWPRLVDEAEAIFQNKQLVTLNKQSIDGLYSRRLGSKDRPGLNHEQPAYSTLLYTSNYPPFQHTQDGSIRRYNLIYFDETCKFTPEEKEEFKNRWLTDDRGHFQEGTPLENLAPIGQFIAYTISRDHTILKENPFQLADKLITKLYQYAGNEEPPEWFTSWCKFETEEDYREKENQTILNDIRKRIGVSVRYKQPIVDDTGRYLEKENYSLDEVRSVTELRQQLFDVANDTQPEWLRIRNLKNRGECYIIEPGYLQVLEKEQDLHLTMKELVNRFAPLQYVRLYPDKDSKIKTDRVSCAVAPRIEFEKLIYPTYDE